VGQGNRQTVTSVIVNETLGLSRQERRRLRAAASTLQWVDVPNAPRKDRSKIAYLSMLNAQQALPLKLLIGSWWSSPS
jgi:hypothetical protein